MGVIFAFLNIPDKVVDFLKKLSLEESLSKALSQNGYYALGIVFFVVMGYVLYRVATSQEKSSSL